MRNKIIEDILSVHQLYYGEQIQLTPLKDKPDYKFQPEHITKEDIAYNLDAEYRNKSDSNGSKDRERKIKVSDTIHNTFKLNRSAYIQYIFRLTKFGYLINKELEKFEKDFIADKDYQEWHQMSLEWHDKIVTNKDDFTERFYQAAYKVVHKENIGNVHYMIKALRSYGENDYADKIICKYIESNSDIEAFDITHWRINHLIEPENMDSKFKEALSAKCASLNAEEKANINLVDICNNYFCKSIKNDKDKTIIENAKPEDLYECLLSPKIQRFTTVISGLLELTPQKTIPILKDIIDKYPDVRIQLKENHYTKNALNNIRTSNDCNEETLKIVEEILK